VPAVGELAEREDVDDVAVPDLVDRARLGDEPRHDLVVGGVLARQHLDRDALADQRLDRAIHRAEPAAPDRALDLVLADRGPGDEIDLRRRRGAIADRPPLGERLVEPPPRVPAIAGRHAHRAVLVVRARHARPFSGRSIDASEGNRRHPLGPENLRPIGPDIASHALRITPASRRNHGPEKKTRHIRR
jgi:hypothetical protein